MLVPQEEMTSQAKQSQRLLNASSISQRLLKLLSRFSQDALKDFSQFTDSGALAPDSLYSIGQPQLRVRVNIMRDQYFHKAKLRE